MAQVPFQGYQPCEGGDHMVSSVNLETHSCDCEADGKRQSIQEAWSLKDVEVLIDES